MNLFNHYSILLLLRTSIYMNFVLYIFDSGSKYFLTNHNKEIKKLIDLFISDLIIIQSNIIRLPAGRSRMERRMERTDYYYSSIININLVSIVVHNLLYCL